MELKWLKFAREWNVNLNLRPSAATRRKGSIIGWEGREVACGYSRL
jgi:hypothetical protein